MILMNKGAVPIPYIIALVLAIIVIALVVYWLFFSSGDFGDIISEKGCEAKKMAYCSEYKTSSSSTSFSTSCDSINDNNKNEYYAPECCFDEKFHGSADTLCQ
jgi:hypothetical protein